ncbi:cellulose binding domain-containing protein [Nonomuraea sp. SMC257]|uniref:Cellulose binding domain-containing protein n=1 Tax=Nonomuraea montanisoli TaxID=2741721 RepID=A0A7Y6M682_9ACTN|nr:glycoside hydrolase family 48 protein [Nonomuraea montanisoli]NUW36137.1 cellulose binding domain-containing protein [Nonomuraea montanisoli]
MRHRLLAALAVLVLSVSTALAGAGTAMAAVACSVTYVKSWDSGGGFGANITITNTGDPLTSWRLTYAWPGNQQVTNGWSAAWSQSGQNVTATNLSYNGTQASGAQWTIGFNGSYSGTNTNPTSFAVNGVTCGGNGPGPDPGQQALQVSPTAVTVPEGGTATYGVRLATQPTSNVTVTSTAGSGDADLTVTSGAGLTFTSANWNTVQNVTVSAAQDSDTTNGSRSVTVAAGGLTSVSVTATEADDDAPPANTYVAEFTTQYNKLKDPANGYFSPEGIPYHSIETLIVEAPDHGHETTSEAFSFWLWLEAQYGRVTGNWAPFNNAWNVMEQYIIPSAGGQPGGSSTYNPNDPADYAPEKPQPSGYPVTLDSSVVAGQDPLANELQSTYGNRNVYGMHWLLDVDDVYGYGTGRGANLSECGDNTKRVTYINTFQRGPQESTWETVAHPSCETGRFGKSGAGYPPLFIQGGGANQWRYTDAPDADARAVQAAYWALTWATAQGKQSQISTTLTKAAKMGDFLRYAFYDKYFKNPGCTSKSCAAGSGKSSSSYLLTWYYAWGGDTGGAWAWRVGSSSWHQGYQNPLAAWVLSPSGPTSLRPQSPTAASDWQTSLNRQLDSYLWLQSAEGGIAGGATNSWNGDYQAPPAGTPTFYGWAYDWQPVYHDPPSNRWFGFQAWSLERVAEYYYVTGDAKAKAILDKWVPWALANTTFGSGGDYRIPNDMTWTGAPAASYSGGGTPGPNPGLHVTVANTTQDVGVAAAYARTLTWYAAKSGNAAAKTGAKNLIDGILAHKDAKGAVVSETRDDYNRFDDPNNDSTNTGLYIPPGYTGTMPNGDQIAPGKTFLDIRSFYKTDPDWPKVQSYLNGGSAPTFTYHRFWAQADIAMAAADYGTLFPNG